jgi:hypothetical protein
MLSDISRLINLPYSAAKSLEDLAGNFEYPDLYQAVSKH